MQVKKEEKREKILRAAMELFAEKGFENVTTMEIAGKAGVGKGTLYTYFPSKEDIFLGVVRKVYESFIDDIKTSLEDAKDASQFFDELVERMFRDIKHRSRILSIFRRMETERSSYREFQREYERAVRELYRRFESEIDASFDEIYFLITSFFMTAYILSRDLPESKVKHTVKSLFHKLLISNRANRDSHALRA